MTEETPSEMRARFDALRVAEKQRRDEINGLAARLSALEAALKEALDRIKVLEGGASDQ